jgi:photosystem II stability/assembly factor-like uncharacterized protein
MKSSILIIILSLLIYDLNAQNNEQADWRELQNQGENFYTIQELMETKYANNSTNKKLANYSQSYKQYKRWAQYWQTRIDERGNFVSAQQTWEESMKLKESNNTRSSVASNWSIIGPITIPTSTSVTYGGMGRINCVTWEAGNTNNLYVGSPAGGLWKSTNGGTSWTPLTDNQITLGISDIVVSHANVNVIYLATGDADGQHNSSVGVLKSTDAGVSWNQTGLVYAKSDVEQVTRIVQHPTTANTLLASATDGIYKTTNGGTTWSNVDGQETYDLEYDPNNASIMYASGSGDILKSTDGGDTWNGITPSGFGGKIQLALTAANSNYILALNEQGVLMQSANGGSAWTAVSGFPSTLFNAQGGYNLSLAIAPTNQNLIMVGGVNGWRSLDGGATWTKYLDGYWEQGDPFFYVHSDHHVFKFLPNSTTMFTGNDGGLHKGDVTLSTPWTDLSSGLAITQYYGLAADVSNSNTILAGAQDNDATQYDGSTWFNRNGAADGIEGLIDPSNPTMVQYSSTQAGALTRTDDGWLTDNDIAPTFNNCGFVWPMNLDPVTPSTIYGGCDEIYKSVDKGDNWSAITNGQSGGNTFTKLAIAPSNPSVIFAAYDNNSLITTSNGGTTWTSVAAPDTISELTRIAIHPTNPQKVWITYGGYIASNKVYSSVNGGATWINRTGTLPNIPVNCIIAQSGAVNDDLYIGTDLGVFHIDNTLSDWQLYSVGLPNVIVNDLEITYSTGKLRAATFGRGVWESDLNTVASNISSVENDAFDWTVAPNPTKGLLEVNISEKDAVGNYSITVYNLLGGVVYHKTGLSEGQYTVDLSSYSNAVYMMTIATKNSMQTKKIMIAK